MFEIILMTCLAADASSCREERIAVDGNLATCRSEARAIAASPPPDAVVQSYGCRGDHLGPDAFAMSEVAPGVFVHRGLIEGNPSPDNRGDLANLGFVVGSDAVAVIDSGTHPYVGRGVLAAIRAETELPIKWIIYTHMHPDHVLGIRPLLADGGTVIAHEKLTRGLGVRAAGYLAAMQRMGLVDLSEEDVVMPTEVVADERTIDLGDRVLTLRAHATAHTSNDLTVMDEKTGTLFLGDLLFVDHAPAIDGSVLGWQEVLKELMELPAERAVPGHGPVTVPWPEGGKILERYLEVLAADLRKAIADGMPMIEAITRMALSERAKWLLFDEFNPRNASTAYQELEWE